MGREKKQHYVPASYLARFTRSGTDEGDLLVFDLDRAASWKSKRVEACQVDTPLPVLRGRVEERGGDVRRTEERPDVDALGNLRRVVWASAIRMV